MSNTKGIAAVLISSVIFGLMPFFAGMFYEGGGNAASAVLFRMLIPMLPLYIYLKIKKIPLAITRRESLQILLITVFGYGGTAFLLLSSYQYISGGMATTIHFIYPAFVILMGILFLKEKPSAINMLCVALCLAGIFLFHDADGGGTLSGIIIAFASGITYAFYIIYLSRSGLSGIPPYKLIFYMHLIMSVLLLAYTLATGTLTIHVKPTGWMGIVLLALVVTLLAVMLFQNGVRTVGSQKSAILSTFEPITSLVVGALLLGEPLTGRNIIGCVLILAAVLLISLKPKKQIRQDAL